MASEPINIRQIIILIYIRVILFIILRMYIYQFIFNQWLRPQRPLKALVVVGCLLSLVLKRKISKRGAFFQGLLFLLGGLCVVPSLRIALYLSRTYQKRNCKGEPYRFSGQQDPLVQTDRTTKIYFIESTKFGNGITTPKSTLESSSKTFFKNKDDNIHKSEAFISDGWTNEY